MTAPIGIRPQDRLAWEKHMLLDQGLTPTDFRVACAIGAHFNNGSRRTFVSAATIAHELGLHLRTVQRSIRTLVRRGYLNVIAGGGRGKANTYEMPQLKNDGMDATLSREKGDTQVGEADRNHSGNRLKGGHWCHPYS